MKRKEYRKELSGERGGGRRSELRRVEGERTIGGGGRLEEE